MKERTSTVTVRWERGVCHLPETVFLGVTYLFVSEDGWLQIIAGKEHHWYRMHRVRSISQIENGTE